MAARKDQADEAATVETTETVKVQGIVEKPAPEPNPAPTEPEKAATAPSADEEVVANIGHVRVRTAAEKRMGEETDTKEDHWLRPAKEAHAEAARLSVLATVGTETQTSDVRGTTAEDAASLVRARLLFDWIDGQGVSHLRGKEMDLPRNEAVKLIEEGRAERADPPAGDPVALAMAEARMAVMADTARK